jgi:hypothetical protein
MRADQLAPGARGLTGVGDRPLTCGGTRIRAVAEAAAGAGAGGPRAGWRRARRRAFRGAPAGPVKGQ